jgi:hypothetical protein
MGVFRRADSDPTPLTIYREVATPEMKALVEVVGHRVKVPKATKSKKAPTVGSGHRARQLNPKTRRS